MHTFCRARGKENFFHCDKCGFCLALEKKENHTCLENSSKNNCPICMEVSKPNSIAMTKLHLKEIARNPFCLCMYVCRIFIHLETLLMYLDVAMSSTRKYGEVTDIMLRP